MMDDYNDNMNLLSDDDNETEVVEETATESLPEEAPQADAAPVEAVTVAAPAQRVFKIGSVRIPENDTTAGKTVDQVKALLKAAYPEVANATPREHTDMGVHLVEFLPQPGRKG